MICSDTSLKDILEGKIKERNGVDEGIIRRRVIQRNNGDTEKNNIMQNNMETLVSKTCC